MAPQELQVVRVGLKRNDAAAGPDELGRQERVVPRRCADIEDLIARANVLAKQSRLLRLIGPQEQPRNLAATGELPTIAAQRADDEGDGKAASPRAGRLLSRLGGGHRRAPSHGEWKVEVNRAAPKGQERFGAVEKRAVQP